VWLVTLALTVFADLTVAVEAGMILAALLFISRVRRHHHRFLKSPDDMSKTAACTSARQGHPINVTIFRIHGPFLFGATDKINAVIEDLHTLPPVVILRLRKHDALDATGLFAIEEVARQLHASNAP